MSTTETKTPLIYTKMNAVMRDIGAVTKDQKNTVQNYKFRGVDQFVNALYPALVRHGVFMTPHLAGSQHELREVTRSNGKPGVDKHVNISMFYTFYAEDGSSVKVGPIPGEGIDSGDKATNKALSAALKYALIQTFSIPTEDMAEADKESPELATNVKVYPPAEGTTTTTTTVSSFRKENKPIVNGTKATTPVVTEDDGWDN